MTVGLVLFNLLVNANLALLGSVFLVALGLRMLSPGAYRLRALLLLAPLCKAAYEVMRGIPSDAFFWLKLGGAAQEHGTFRLGFGLAPPVVPVVDASCMHGGTRPTIHLEAGQTAELTHFDPKKQSLVIEFQAGETLPLDITIEGDYLESPRGASVPLTVKRHCFLRVDDRGPRLSDDGKDFDKKSRVPGTFQFGVSATKVAKRATLHVVTPQH